MARSRPFVIDHSTDNDKIFFPRVDGERKGMGLVPRDFKRDPFDPKRALPSEMKLIPRSEWSERIKDLKKYKMRTEDMIRRMQIPSTDQGNHGYCWAYSTGGAIQALRAWTGTKHVPLNPHSVASIIKQGRDEGGWCGLSAEFNRNYGIVPTSMWPTHSRDYKRYWTEEAKKEAAKYRVTEDWVDINRNVYDQNLTWDQIATLLLLPGVQLALDYNEWGHSVWGCDLEEVERGDFRPRIRNSWTDGWGDLGFATMQRWDVDGAVAFRVVGMTGW